MKKAKHIILVVIALMMLSFIMPIKRVNAVSTVDVSSLAEIKNAITSAGTNETTIRLTGNIDSDGTTTIINIPSGADITITDDGNGRELKLWDCSFSVQSGGKLSFKSKNTATPFNLVTSGGSTNALQNEFIKNAGTLNFEGVTINFKHNNRSFVNNTNILNIIDSKVIGASTNTPLTDLNNGITNGMFALNGGATTVSNTTFTKIAKTPVFVLKTNAQLTMDKKSSMTECGSLGVYGAVDGTPIMADDNSKLVIDDCSFSNNKGTLGTTNTTYGGGVIALLGSSQATITNVTTTGNEGYFSGGFLSVVGNGAKLEMSKCNLNKDKALQHGGSLYFYAGSSTLEEITITQCSADMCGGGIEITNSANVSMNKCKITSCVASKRGGGISVDNSSGIISLTDCTIDNNKCTGKDTDPNTNGGGFSTMGNTGTITIDKVTMSNNRAEMTGYGGGAFFGRGWYENKGTILVKDMTLDKNYAGSVGGGMDTGNVDMTIEHVTATNNTSAAWGGGIGVHDGPDNPASIKIKTAEIHDNTADWLGGGIYVGKGSVLVLEDTVIYENKAVDKSVGYPTSDWLGQGGGVWICPTGELDSYLNRGGAIFKNSAATAGDDVGVIKTTEDESTTVAPIMLGGGDYNWYKDLAGARYETGKRIVAPATYYTNTKEALYLRQNASTADTDKAKSQSAIMIYNNSAAAGGGVGSNGAVVFGTQGIISVEKVWDDKNFESFRPDSITVILSRNGQEFARENLTADNQWKCEFRGLDFTYQENGETKQYKYTVSEVKVSRYESTVTTVSSHDGCDKIVTVTNTFKKTKTNIYVPFKKTESGDALPAPQVYTFELSAATEGAPMPSGATGNAITVSLNGAGNSGYRLTYDDDDVGKEYIYLLKEVTPTVPLSGMSYDKTVYKIIVTVKYSNSDRKLVSAGFDVRKVGDEGHYTPAVFDNKYTIPTTPIEPPYTGDNNHIFLYGSLMIITIVSIAGTVIYTKKKKSVK